MSDGARVHADGAACPECHGMNDELEAVDHSSHSADAATHHKGKHPTARFHLTTRQLILWMGFQAGIIDLLDFWMTDKEFSHRL